MEASLQNQLTEIFTRLEKPDLIRASSEYRALAAANGSVPSFLADYEACYTGGKSPQECLDSVVSGTTVENLDLNKAKTAITQYYQRVARRLAAPTAHGTQLSLEEGIQAYQAQMDAYLERLLRALPAAARNDFTEYAKVVFSAAFKNADQKNEDQNHALLLLVTSALDVGRVSPAIPWAISGLSAGYIPATHGLWVGGFDPTEEARLTTADQLTNDEFSKRRWVLLGAEALEALPAYDGWLAPLIETGPGGSESGGLQSQAALAAGLTQELPAAINNNQVLVALAPLRGRNMSGGLEAASISADLAGMFADGARHTYLAVHVGASEKQCKIPDSLDDNQLRDSTIIEDWKKEHPGEKVPLEVIERARSARSMPVMCDELVGLALAPDRFIRDYEIPIAMERRTEGLVTDIVGNHNIGAGIVVGVIVMVGMPATQYAIRSSAPNWRYSLNPRAYESTGDTPGVSASAKKDMLQGAVLEQGAHHLVGGVIALLAIKWDEAGYASNRRVAMQLLSASDGVVRARPRERLIEQALNDGHGSTMGLFPLFIETGTSAANAFGAGFGDAALLHRLDLSSNWQIVQGALVVAGRLTETGFTISGIHDSFYQKGDGGIPWILLGVRGLAYGLGWLAYEWPAQVPRARTRMEAFHFVGPRGGVIGGNGTYAGNVPYRWDAFQPTVLTNVKTGDPLTDMTGNQILGLNIIDINF